MSQPANVRSSSLSVIAARTMMMRWPAKYTAIVVALAALATAFPLHAQDVTITVAGQVVNGTEGAVVLPGAQVSLYMLRAGQEAEPRTTTADDTGQFIFTDVPRDATRYAVMTEYLGVDYSIDLAPDAVLSNIQLPVYEQTSSMAQISLSLDSILVLGVDADTSTASLWEIAAITNAGDRVFVPDLTSAMNLLRFPLPPGAGMVEVQSELPEGQVVQVEIGFALTTPVPPGEHRVAFTYQAPYSGGTLDLSRTLRMGAAFLAVLVPEGLGTVSTSSAATRDTVTISRTTYNALEMADFPLGSSVDIRIEGLPEPSVVERIRTALDGKSSAVLVPTALLFGLAVILVVGIRRQGAVEGTPALVQVNGQEGLIQAIALLDTQFRQGEIEEELYQAQRESLKAELLRLAWEQGGNV